MGYAEIKAHYYSLQLRALKGDKGALDLFRAPGVTEVARDDAGILQDIDISQDLHWSP